MWNQQIGINLKQLNWKGHNVKVYFGEQDMWTDSQIMTQNRKIDITSLNPNRIDRLTRTTKDEEYIGSQIYDIRSQVRFP